VSFRMSTEAWPGPQVWMPCSTAALGWAAGGTRKTVGGACTRINTGICSEGSLLGSASAWAPCGWESYVQSQSARTLVRAAHNAMVARLHLLL
jgi:hypothetical protein